MYKILIADDEKAVRERLINQIKEMSQDFEIVGCYENGYDALTYGLALEPNLIISDIKMPYINGIDFIRQAKQELPLVESIIISGFDSFDYAKQAISLGVISYISKPITKEELEKALKNAKVQLDLKLRVTNDMETLQRKIESSMEALQSKDLIRLSTLKDVPDNFKSILAEEKIDISYSYQLYAIFDVDVDIDSLSFEKEEMLRYFITKYFHEEFEETYVSYTYEENHGFVALICDNNPMDISLISHKFSAILAKIKNINVCTVSVGVSNIDCNKENQINYRKLYRHARRALEYRTVVGNNMVLYFSDLEKEETSVQNVGKIDENEYKSISYNILYGKHEEAYDKIKSILKTISSPNYKVSYAFILESILECLMKSCINLPEFYTSYMGHVDLVRTLYSLKSNEEILFYFKDLITRITKVNKSARLSGVELSFKQFKDYILANYSNAYLSLDDVATELNYSVSYISAILKNNETSFTKYLTEVRMKKAGELLQDNANKVITVASLVGYSDPYYFSHCFKKFYGVSPIEYKKK